MGERVELMTKGSIDTSARGLASKLPIRVYNINDKLSAEEMKTVERILADPVVDEVATNKPVLGKIPEDSFIIEQTPKPGVTDPEGNEAKTTIERIIGRKLGPVSFSRQYLWQGELTKEEYFNFQKTVGNPLIHEFRRIPSSEWDSNCGIGFHFPSVDLPEPGAFEYIDISVSDKELTKISGERLGGSVIYSSFILLNKFQVCILYILNSNKV